ncbi:MAG: ribokinase [Bacteroidales bacterium]
MKILVVGSSNIDIVAQVNHLPLPGETVGNAVITQAYGGKGANQAVAAARLGGNVTFVTFLGNDLYSKSLTEHFKNEGIFTKYILIDTENPTGIALIFVASNAENCIAVAPGSNGKLLPAAISKFESAIDSADMLVMQAEIPYETIKQTALLAHKKGVKVLLNPAPACPIDKEFMQAVDILVVNETESEMISGLNFEKNNIDVIANALMNQGAKNVVITLGRKGAYLRTETTCCQVPGFKVDAVDTTAAGDTFCGALAVFCAGNPLNEKALRFASAAAAISVTRLGAQPSVPKLEEVITFLQQH